MLYKSFLVLFAFMQIAFCAQLSSVITPDDGKRLSNYFKAPFSDLETAYYAINGIKQYTQGGAIGTPEKDSACKLVKSCDTKSLTSVYYAASVLRHLGSSCKHDFSKETLEFVNNKISETSDIRTLHTAVLTMRSLRRNVDSDLVVSALLNAVKADNSVMTSSLALLTASTLNSPNLAPLLKSVDIEDMAAQADEVDERYLHFDNDLEATSTFLSAVFAIGEVTKQSLGISSEQIILFSNFILRSKTSASTTKDAYLIFNPLGRITSSTQVSVVKAELVSGSSISEENPAVSVFICNVFGQPLTRLAVKADSVVRANDNEVIVSNAPFKFDGTKLYKLVLWKNNPKSGFYDVTLAVSAPGSELVGVSDFEFKVKITTKIGLVNVELGAPEKDQSGAILKSISYPAKAIVLRADSQQKVVMKFQVQDLNDKSLIQPHQAFVRFLNLESGQEVIFVAEPDKDSTFKFEVELASAGREQFNSASGKYSMHLIVGDAAIANPIFWNFGEIVLKLEEVVQKPKISFKQQFTKKPEIHHMFRKPEDRPPVVVSQAFTAACLIPILVLFVLWGRVGANLGNLSLSPKNLLFHLGVAGIFVLYYFFWMSLNMFQTMQYLLGIGTLTFIFGNMVLSDLANHR